MVVGEALQTQSRRSASSRNLSNLAQTSRLPNSVSTQARIPSNASTPTHSTFPSNQPRPSSHTIPSNAPISVPPPRGTTQTYTQDVVTHQRSQNAHDGEAQQGYDRNGFPLTTHPQGLASTPPSPRLQPTHRSMQSFNGSAASSPARIKVRDLNHIQSFASEERLTRSRHGSRHSLRGRLDAGQQYQINEMPVTDIIEMVAGLLTKITTTNDQQHEHLHRHIPPPEGTSGLSQQDTSVLAFHGKNVPSITILSYLSRIHKYCPTTYEVFLSLLVYFDRMTEMVNNGTLQSFRDDASSTRSADRPESISGASDMSGSTVVVPSSSEVESSSNSFEGQGESERTATSAEPLTPPPSTSASAEEDAYNLSHFFVVDNFNIHRLVIAGVTCASKFFSDVFYTNSRYAKVGGLPLVELNHLELQFLLLNDFRLSVPVEELEAYGDMLVEFYAREVLAQQQNANGMASEGLYMQSATSA
ncbi:MAG: hypothetical protein LQ342_005620 [Letrouitia transgressa]|nr:MAG: hypothetical protein LQ342_005620 [Letrouitia transgressa]